MMSVESAVWVVVRAVLGIFCSTGLAAIVWVLSRYFPQDSVTATTQFLVTQALIIAVPAGVGATAAWWNPDNPPILRLLYAALIPALTFVCGWLTIAVRGVETYHALFGGTHRVPVIETGDLIGTLIVSSVIGANVIAGGLYVYRLVRYREA